MRHIKITSLSNDRVKRLVRLRESRERKKTQTFLIEGWKEANHAWKAGIEFLEVYRCEEDENQRDNDSWFQDYLQADKPLFDLNKDVFQKIAYGNHDYGIIIVAKTAQTDLKNILLSNNPFCLVLEALEKPGNLGAILRTADAVGIDAVFVCDPQTDLYNPNVIRSSRGSIFTVPVVVELSENILNFLKEKNISVLAMTPGGDKNFYEEKLNGPIAMVLGTEDQGLSEKWLNEVNKKVKIPMLGQMDSLNVSVSAAVVMYEVLRQRELEL